MSEPWDDDAITAMALAVGRGDQTAAEPFIRSTRHDVWRFLVGLVGYADAEDLTQETYVRALASMRQFAGRSHARPWLFTIARRVAADHLRIAASQPWTVPDQDWQSAMDHVTASHLPGVDDIVAIRAAVRTLPRGRRVAFLLTQVFGLEYAEAADVCGCPVGTIRSRVARARRDLASVLGVAANACPASPAVSPAPSPAASPAVDPRPAL